jgi:glutamate-1-semialdehyde 2,1-aminomutase
MTDDSRMTDRRSDARRRLLDALEHEYARRFPRSEASLGRSSDVMLDGTSHAIRWNFPFMPVVAKAAGSVIEDLDGHRIIDYWQGHFANVLGHNPPRILQALRETLDDGRGLQSGMLHEIEGEVCELIARCTGTEKVRLTTSGSLGTFYSVLLARAFTGRDRVVKIAGGWHGSQPFGLKGVSARGGSFDHLESEGLSSGIERDIVLTRFNDVEGLRRIFAEQGDTIACLLIEPILGSGGGMVASREYLEEARRLTRHHGALLLCDEIITAFRFRAGDLSALYGVKPDLLILGKAIGGGMPVAAVAGCSDVLELATRRTARVKFEGGTYSAHELSLVAAREMLRHVVESEAEVYDRLAELGEYMRAGLERVSRETGVPLHVLGAPGDVVPGSSLVFVYIAGDGEQAPRSPEDVTASRPPVDDGLLKSVLLLEDVSVRSGLGAVSTAHSESDLDRTLDGFRAAFQRLRRAGLI